MISPVGSGVLFPPLSVGAGSPHAPAIGNPSNRAAELRGLHRATRTLRHLLEGLRVDLRSGGTRVTPAAARSSSALNLIVGTTKTALNSSEEINATPTSFSPFGPSFEGSSTSRPTVTGVYDGSNGTDVLTFKVRKSGTIGGNPSTIQIDVLDGTGARIDRINITPYAPADQAYTLDNGLVVSFSAGLANKNDNFTVSVSDSIGSVVRADQPFDGVRNNYANFEYGTSILNGSFQVNGVSISVAAGDTLAAVLQRITSSGADVDASLDAATERIVLTRKTAGSAYDIALSGDTSNFLASTKLSGATSVLGQDGEGAEEILANVPQFASVTSGTVRVNGQSIFIDTAVDSLEGVLARINASGAGAVASYSSSTGRASIAPTDPTSPLVIDDGATGFFAALHIAAGTYEPTIRKGVPGVDRATRRFHDVVEAMNALFSPPKAGGEKLALESSLEADLRSIVRDALGTASSTTAGTFRPQFDLRAEARRFLKFRSQDAADLRASLRGHPEGTRRLFFSDGAGRDRSLFGAMIERLREAESAITAEAGTSGVFLDVVA